MITLAAILLVVLGLLCISAIVRPTIKICQSSTQRGWRFLFALIVIFIFAYAAFAYYIFVYEAAGMELGLSAILFAGGVFVNVIISLSLSSIESLQAHALEKYNEARRDSLTGLPNRLYFMEKIDKVIEDAAKTGACFSVLMIDLDRFKEVNDTLGHAVGDRLLREFAHRQAPYVTQGQIVARLGGDEFAWILMNADKHRAIEHTQKLKQTVADFFSIDDCLLSIEMSVGVSLFPENGDNKEMLLKCADVAMYGAKKSIEHFMLYNHREDTFEFQKLTIISQAQLALEENLFEIRYQPIINDESTLYGFEVLIRWPQSDGSYIAPSLFIPLLDKSRHIGKVTRWVIDKAISDLSLWHSNHYLYSLSINLSSTDVQDFEIVSFIKNCSEKYDVSPEYLCFEITESAIMVDTKRAKEVVQKIVELGAKIAIDDFGTGYSSLSAIVEFPAHLIKIDRSFVADIEYNKASYSIVNSVINLSHNLGRKVVIEGVENKSIRTVLEKMNCDYMQGYYFSKPLTYQQASHFLENK